MSQKIPKISEAEWEVMKVLWTSSPRGSADIVDELAARTQWKPNTVKTMLARLVKKGAVAADKNGRDHTYSPCLTEEQCIRAESRSFISRVYDGSMMSFIAGFLQQEKLSPEEIARLRELLDTMEKKTK